MQLSLLEDDVVELELKSPTASGQRVVHLHPVHFLRRLAYLIPPPGRNQVRYYGVFAPTHGLRAEGGPKPVELAACRLDDSPLESIRNTDSVRMVVLNGRLFDAATMDQIAPELHRWGSQAFSRGSGASKTRSSATRAVPGRVHPARHSQSCRPPPRCTSSPTRRGNGPAMHIFGRTWYRSGDGASELRPTRVSEAGC